MVLKAWLAVTLFFVFVLLASRTHGASMHNKAMLALWYGLAIVTLWVAWFSASRGKYGLSLFVYRADTTSNIQAVLLVLLLDGIDLWCAWRIDDPMEAANEALAILRLLIMAGWVALLVWRIAILVGARSSKDDKTDDTP